MTEYKRTSLNFIESKKQHHDAELFLSLVGKKKTEVVVRLVLNYLENCGISDISQLDQKTAKKMANELIIPNENSRLVHLLQGIRNDLVSTIANGTVINETNTPLPVINTTANINYPNSSEVETEKKLITEDTYDEFDDEDDYDIIVSSSVKNAIDSFSC